MAFQNGLLRNGTISKAHIISCLAFRPVSHQHWACRHARLLASFRSIPKQTKQPSLTTVPSSTRTQSSIAIPIEVASHLEPEPSTPPVQDVGLPAYKLPTKGILSLLPTPWVPYAELIRLEKPAGTTYLFLPCVFGTLLAASIATPVVSPAVLLSTNAFFLVGSALFRGAACTWNDTLDRDLDKQVARTRLRPLARGAISPTAAHVWTGTQVVLGLGMLQYLPPQCLLYSLPSVAIITFYPLAKRLTNYPQLVLGFAWSWGIVMGFPAMGIDLISNTTALTAAACLYTANIAWTVLYDTIYAHQDVKDDVKAGIKSIAVAHEGSTKLLLSGLGAVQVSLLAATGFAIGAGPAFYAGTCGLTTIALATMIRKVNLKKPSDCWWWFNWGAWLTGGSIASGFLAEYILRLNAEQDERARAGDSILIAESNS